jgi:hypothetical protein
MNESYPILKMMTNVVRTGVETDTLTATEIYASIKRSDYYDLISKMENRRFTKPAIIEFLKKHNINYTFLSFMALDESIKKLNIYKEINLDKFLYIEYDSEILFNGILSHLKKEEMTLDFGGHANEKGNFLVANELLKKLKLKELELNNNKLC